MPLPYVFPGWTMEKSKKVATIYLIVQAAVLMVAFSAMLINSLFGKTLQFVTLISVAFIISNTALAVATLLFN